MKVKVCGMRDPVNIKSLLDLNVDYIGLIFYSGSSRYVSELTFPEIHSDVFKTGVFVNEGVEGILSLSAQYKLNAIQLHGNESPELCRALKINHKVIKAFSIDDNFNWNILTYYQNQCDYFLFDTKGKSHGGNGLKFNWSLLEKYKLSIPFFLSGGIGADDAAEIKQLKHPMLYGVDLNSGFELSPGLKDISKIKNFIQSLKTDE